MAASRLKEVGAVVGQGRCSGPALSFRSCSAGGECSALAELCRALPCHSCVLGGLRRWHAALPAGLLPCRVLGCRDSKPLLCCNVHLPVPPQSLPKSHVETRERQTIIPHGVPFMVKLLCYYVSEDSIFLHLEHVQGE